MQMRNSMYDAVIVGAGIGGLVCGCCLAKEGMKVLIVEQHHKPGGYCTSFKRKSFIFDAAAHSFGSYREGGNMRRVLEALDVDARLKIKKYDPSDIITSPDYKITFWTDIDRTKQELQEAFPAESKNISQFLHYLLNSKPIDFAALRKSTFKNLLDHYFENEKLKAILAIPVLGNGGLPPSAISAFTGAKIFAEFILDGGYSPEGGMQAVPDVLAQRFKELGGELRLSCLAKKIAVSNDGVKGVFLDDAFVQAKYVVSNCDARQTFLKLLGKSIIGNKFTEKIESMVPSLSILVLYLGLDGPFGSLPTPGSNTWHLAHYDLESMFISAKKMDRHFLDYYMARLSPDSKTILGFINAPFKTKKFWTENKSKYIEMFINAIERHTIPHLSQHIAFKDAGSPYTMYRYTLNFKGAAYGWATVPQQLFTPELRQTTAIPGLFLTGHWTAQTQGIPGVAYLGYSTAQSILKRNHKDNFCRPTQI